MHDFTIDEDAHNQWMVAAENGGCTNQSRIAVSIPTSPSNLKSDL